VTYVRRKFERIGGLARDRPIQTTISRNICRIVLSWIGVVVMNATPCGRKPLAARTASRRSPIQRHPRVGPCGGGVELAIHVRQVTRSPVAISQFFGQRPASAISAPRQRSVRRQINACKMHSGSAYARDKIAATAAAISSARGTA